MRTFYHFLNLAKAFYLSAKRFYKEDYTYSASALAFITLLSLVPSVSIVLYFFSYFTFFSTAISSAKNYIYQNFLPSTTEQLQIYIDQFLQQTQQLPAISIIFSVLTGILLILTIENSINHIWKVGHQKRNIVATFISWIVLLFMPLLVGYFAFISTYISSFFVSQYQFVLLGILNLITNSLLIGILYISLPTRYVTWQEGLLGGVIAACLFDLGKKLFILYISFMTNYEYIYGTLAIIPIFLVWLYFSWSIILFGALFIYEIKNSKSLKGHRG